MKLWKCPQCDCDDRNFLTDNTRWLENVYYMEYLCENCGYVYEIYLKPTSIILPLEGEI